jgi:hypothetical protein
MMTQPTSAPASLASVHELPTRDGPLRVLARLLGYNSSRQDDHTHTGPHAERGERCSACRWFEVRIFEVVESEHDAHYLLHTLGGTTVPGEITKCRASWTNSALELVELLTDRFGNVPYTSRRALAQAGDVDQSLRAAYLDLT